MNLPEFIACATAKPGTLLILNARYKWEAQIVDGIHCRVQVLDLEATAKASGLIYNIGTEGEGK